MAIRASPACFESRHPPPSVKHLPEDHAAGTGCIGWNSLTNKKAHQSGPSQFSGSTGPELAFNGLEVLPEPSGIHSVLSGRTCNLVVSGPFQDAWQAQSEVLASYGTACC